ncbi:ISL3 family transposase [Paenibacillus sp. N3.4]|uniref:ISL3 family transposase n=1 Tax=Paenibacillus sp. N3.4 TaxID=2603222 RepID=UPI0011C9744C|nr:ISL3 family transposase [Paenibacillus sp. N3.4]TXK66240.1 ISL3 family transposase [Paenibacillus sp. N3.4]
MEEYENDLDMFQAALEIESPWFVSYRELDRQARQLHVYLNFKRGAAFSCQRCGINGKVHDIVNEDRTWRHLDFWQYQTILHARLPRIHCKHCDKITTVKVSWARVHTAFSWLFEAHVMALMTEMPVAAVARKVGEHDTRLWRIFHYYVDRAMNEMDMTGVKRIALDETSSRRGHEYVTLFVDIDTKQVLLATEGKGSSGLLTFKQFLTQRSIDPTQIREACCDMSAAFIAGIEEHFPAAQITFDKFHVMKLVNEAVDEVRREEQKEVVGLKKTRYIWLKNESRLTEGQKQTMLKLKDMNLQTGKAYRLKLALQDMWTYPAIYADLYFKQWTQWAVRSQVEPMSAVARSLQRYANGILRWFQTKMTNGLLEGLNSLVQAAKRKARGYRSTRNFIAMIYATANKLKMKVEPH